MRIFNWILLSPALVLSIGALAECPAEKAELQSCISSQTSMNNQITNASFEIDTLTRQLRNGSDESQLNQCRYDVRAEQDLSYDLQDELNYFSGIAQDFKQKERQLDRRVGGVDRYTRQQFLYYECVVTDRRYGLTAVGTSTKREKNAIKDARNKAHAKWGKTHDVGRYFERAKNWFDDDEFETFCFEVYKAENSQGGPGDEWTDREDDDDDRQASDRPGDRKKKRRG